MDDYDVRTYNPHNILLYTTIVLTDDFVDNIGLSV